MRHVKILLLSSLFASMLFGVSYEMSAGVHDFIVNDIKNPEKRPSHIQSGTSHTFGLNAALWIRHTPKEGINLLAKAQVLQDRDKDELDKDHIPIWFDFFLHIDGEIYKLNKYNSLKWYVYMDNRQNTVSCIEREVRQHIGAGWQFKNKNFTFALNGYLGFYYIEIDDDTPSTRGYTRDELDNGEASNAFEAQLNYQFNSTWSLHANLKRYFTNAGFNELETNYKINLTYKNTNSFLTKGSSLNLQIQYHKYNFDNFNIHPLPILPWDNDALVEFFVRTPIYSTD